MHMCKPDYEYQENVASLHLHVLSDTDRFNPETHLHIYHIWIRPIFDSIEDSKGNDANETIVVENCSLTLQPLESFRMCSKFYVTFTLSNVQRFCDVQQTQAL